MQSEIPETFYDRILGRTPSPVKRLDTVFDNRFDPVSVEIPFTNPEEQGVRSPCRCVRDYLASFGKLRSDFFLHQKSFHRIAVDRSNYRTELLDLRYDDLGDTLVLHFNLTPMENTHIAPMIWE